MEADMIEIIHHFKDLRNITVTEVPHQLIQHVST